MSLIEYCTMPSRTPLRMALSTAPRIWSSLPISVKILGDCIGSICQRIDTSRSEEHTSELQSRFDLVCRLLLEKKKYWALLPAMAAVTDRDRIGTLVSPTSVHH